ncbi:copper amine oxidase N-terminal domain-containing protein [Paenibacillus sp. LHD-117]|uniref:copper amine oxidase N-terminal domain-containing protein n=1 Tax=Paenibacillus sp. LHD-117 TaxID=3071412 RepID=UPI0027E20A78|nr:copper amine oxidase N-terminal domain-containing protein [Paenibacillus sp. LHD-117]MDQ6419459.1 copper amine oxidase N-terminal domain-containing protein [Paenibacillus sp. LHD-117]
MFRTLSKLLLAAAIGLGTMTVPSTSGEIAAAAADVKLADKEAAIKQAKVLKLLPDLARIESAGMLGDKWRIIYAIDDSGTMGSISLDAATGQLVQFNEHKSWDSISGDPNDPPFDIGKEKTTFEEAVAIAEQYANDQGWPLDADWMLNRYPESEYSTRWESKAYHKIRFDRSYSGIRYDLNRFQIWVDRVTGEVVAHHVLWSKTEFNIPRDMLPAGNAAAIFYRELEPFLQWSDGSSEPKLRYAMHAAYTMDAGGEMPKARNNENPPFTDKIKPGYAAELAKKKLLSLYELELQFLMDQPNQAVPFYQLKIKPGVPLFYSGAHPYIDAHTGEWMDFLDQPLKAEVPPASDWLVERAVPQGSVGYKAAVVWNNELLELAGEPLIRNGSTLLPFRELLEKLGAYIHWDPVARKVAASKSGSKVELTIGSGTALVNGKLQPLGAPATIVKGRTYIPTRLVLETFGAKVGWNDGSRLVLVNTDATLPALSAAEIGQLRFEAQLNWEEKQ